MDDEPRAKLTKFVSLLRALAERESKLTKLKQFPPSIPQNLIEFVAGGIERVLDGEEKSLDAALGLKRGRGRPRQDLEATGRRGDKLFWQWSITLHTPLDGGGMPKSFRAALAEYETTPYHDGTLPNLTKADRAHLKRWADDDRADEIWNKIKCAPPMAAFPDGSIEWWFIQEVLGQRRLAEHIYYLRNRRKLHLKSAAQLQQAANILREKAPDGIQRHELAQELEGVAKQYKTFSAVSFDNPRVVKWNRSSKPFGIFISSLSNILKDLSGRWLDYEVAVLAQIAFDDPDIDNVQVEWNRREVMRGRANPKAPD